MTTLAELNPKNAVCRACGGRVWSVPMPEFDPATESEPDYLRRVTAHMRRITQQHIDETKRLVEKVKAEQSA